VRERRWLVEDLVRRRTTAGTRGRHHRLPRRIRSRMTLARPPWRSDRVRAPRTPEARAMPGFLTLFRYGLHSPRATAVGLVRPLPGKGIAQRAGRGEENARK